MATMQADQLRAAFTGFFAERGHEVVPSASLIPHDPSILFTIAGMVPFKPYFLGEQQAPWPRATSAQKCFRTVDIDVVGTTTRHCTFFEMLGNFSFGDYFKEQAIPLSWELVTEILGIDPDQIWITVHEDDDEAATIWTEGVGVAPARLQRLGDDNYWRMGETGPCGPSSEIFFDKGPAYGREGGPARGGPERFVEIWNLVFMQRNRLADGTETDLPRKSIDTGAGLERILPILQGTDSVFATDVLAPLVDAAEGLVHAHYGRDPRADVGLRIMADHARAMTMLVADGVLPSNEGRGYVLRRVVRRAVLAARRLGTTHAVAGPLAAAAAQVMGTAYPEVAADLDQVTAVLEQEEARFDRTLRAGLTLLEDALGGEATTTHVLSGDVAFRLHDTNGFPIELTVELAREAGVEVDRARFEEQMAAQRARARSSARTPPAAAEEAYRSIAEHAGATHFLRDQDATPAQVVAVLAGADDRGTEVFLDRTPFYAEGGGQVGDTGTIVSETGRMEVRDTRSVAGGLIAHIGVVEGLLVAGQDVLATIDRSRRDDVRRNHTATHLLHAALREVLGNHVRQQGSLVAPDRLRFDFSHHGPLDRDQMHAVVDLANADVVTDDPVTTAVVSRHEAEEMGALAFFGDKYGDRVRVVRAGPHSLEFCGGTHVDALGAIGPILVVSEGSIGSGTRRIEAVTAAASMARVHQQEDVVAQAAAVLRTEPAGVIDALERVVERQRDAERELQRLRTAQIEADAATLAGGARDGVVVARRDDLAPDDLRALAQAVRGRDGVRAVVLAGTPDGARAAIVAVTGGEPDATALVRRLASHVHGGGGGSAEVATAGGRDAGGVTDALQEAEHVLAGA